MGNGRECRILARRHTPASSEVAKFWRVTAFDVDTDGDGISDHDEATAGSDPFAGTRIPLRSAFVPFGLRLSNSNWSLTAAEQIGLCQAHGFDGYGLASFGSEAALKAFSDHPEVSSGRFRIHSALWWTEVTSVFNWTDIDRRLAQAARMDMAIWMVVAGTKSAADIETPYTNLKTAAQHCAALGARLVLYPHQGTYDVRPFLQALADAGYTGPMECHTYNLPDPRDDDHFARTLLRWHQLVASPAL